MKKEGIESTGIYMCPILRRKEVETQKGNMNHSNYNKEKKKKGKKTVPLQARSGPEGSRKLRFPDFMTTAQDGGNVVSLTHRPPFPPGNAPGTHFC